jgi:hypothetical protein
MIWSYIDSGVGGLIWQGLLAVDVTLEPLVIELFMGIWIRF